MANKTKATYNTEACYNLCCAILDDAWHRRTPDDITFIKHGWITRMMGIEADDISGALIRRRTRDALFLGLERNKR